MGWFPVSVLVLLSLCVVISVVIAVTLLLVLREIKSRPLDTSADRAYKNHKYLNQTQVPKNQPITRKGESEDKPQSSLSTTIVSKSILLARKR
jgi:hypothetical protein